MATFIPTNYGLTRPLEYGIKLPNRESVFCDNNGRLFRDVNRSWKTAKRGACNNAGVAQLVEQGFCSTTHSSDEFDSEKQSADDKKGN